MVFKPGDYVTIGDRPEVYMLEEDFNGGVAVRRPSGYNHHYASFTAKGVHIEGVLPSLKRYDASEPLPSTPVDFAEQQMTAGTKPTNPKDAIGSGKLPLHLFPTTAIAYGSIAMLDGGLKYGRSNFRAVGIRASIYYDGARRHLDAWFEGEDLAPDTELDHLGYALANIAIIIDARAAGKLNDDRMIEGGYRKVVDHLTAQIARLKELYKDKNPYHYTIKDSAHAQSDDSTIPP